MHPTTWYGKTAVVLTLVIALVLLGCSDPNDVLSPSDNADAALMAGSTLAITPAKHTAVVGGSMQFAAVIIDRRGRIEPALKVKWTIDAPTIASISANGLLVALTPGSAEITAEAYGREISAPVTVTAVAEPVPNPETPVPPPVEQPSPSTEPVFAAGVHTQLWHDDFESATSTASIFSRYVTRDGEDGLNLDMTGGRNGTRGLRMDWRAKSGCTDDSHFIEASFTPSREVIVQYNVRYQSNFVFDWIGRGGACSGNAKKLFFLWAGAGSRFDFISENHVLGVGSDYDHPLFSQNTGTTVTPEALGNGQWHRITLRIRQSSTPTATDGYIHGWIDGVQRWNVNNIASNASGGWVLFKMPATFNQGSPINQSEWIDDVRIWRP